MNSTEAQAEILITLAKTAVGGGVESIIRYCKYLGADAMTMTMVRKLLVAEANDD